MKFKKMMNNMRNDDSFMNNDMMSFDWMKNKDNNNQKSMDFNKMANFFKNFRSKRQAAGDALALNDRLKEKIQHVFEEQQSKIGNMTCVLREMNCLNAENEIDIRAMKKDS